MSHDANKAARFRELAAAIVAAPGPATADQRLEMICRRNDAFRSSPEELAAIAAEALGSTVPATRVQFLADQHGHKPSASPLLDAILHNRRRKRLKRLAAANPAIASMDRHMNKRSKETERKKYPLLWSPPPPPPKGK